MTVPYLHISTYIVVLKKPEGKGPIRRPRLREENTVKMNLKERSNISMAWIHVAHDNEQWQPVLIC